MRTALISTGGFKGPDDALETVRVHVEQARVHGAELICLPQLGFLPYFPAWLAASSYESEGEGLFYVSARLGRSGGEAATFYRQVRVEAAPGRFEQMFWSPGHTGYTA
jgi:hypothetical protein